MKFKFIRLRAWLNNALEKRWFDVGLRTKMSLIVIIGLVGLLTIFTLLGSSTARQTTQQVLSERVMLARLSASSLDGTLRHIENMLTILAEQKVLRDPQFTELERQEALQQVTIFNEGIYFIDINGDLVVSNSIAHHDLDAFGIEAVSSALAGKSFSLSVIPSLGGKNEELHDEHLALISVPVRGVDRQLIGCLAALIDLDDVVLLPLERPFSLGTSGRLEVVDSQGLILVSTQPERVMQLSDQEDIIGRLFVAGEPGVETCLGCYGSESSEGRDEVIAFAPLSQVPWGVVVRQRAQEVFSPVQRLTALNLVLSLAAILGALGLVWVTTNSVIDPVQNLTSAAQRIAGGDLESPIDVPMPDRRFGREGRRDEIGALAESFSIMRRQLKRSIDEIQALNRDLDARVQERTQEAMAAQLEAQAARDDLRAIIDALSDELVVIGVDDRRIQQANKAAQKQNGNRGNILGQVCYQSLHCGKPCESPDCDCPVPMVLESGESVKVTQVYHCKEKGGDCYLDIVASPMRDASGKITRVVELSRDVTEERRIEESLVRRNQQLSIINAVALTVNQSLDIGDILGRALEEVLRLTEIDAGAVFLQEDALGDLKLMAYHGLSKDAAELASEMGMLDSGCGGIIEKGQIVIVPDIRGYRGRRARSLQQDDLSTLVHVPLTAKGCILGSMCVATHQKRQFSDDEQELLMAVGSQIAVAIENARLYAEVQHKEQVRGELFKKAIAAQEEERKRIARELHDDTSQTLTALLYAVEEGQEMKKLADIKQRLEKMHKLTQHTLYGVHKLIFDLRPSMLDHLGLVPALRWFAESRLSPKGMRIDIEESSPPRRLPAEVETALFRVVQEAIINISRHSAARNVEIHFDFSDRAAGVKIKDDGIGFDLTEMELKPDNPRGLGLMGMRERVELLGGELLIYTSPGSGTEILIQVPLNERSPAYA